MSLALAKKQSPNNTRKQKRDNVHGALKHSQTIYHTFPVSVIQRKPNCPCGGGCPKCQTDQPDQEYERLQPKRVQSSDPEETLVLPIVNEVLRSPGEPLDPATRGVMEPYFGSDFSDVRVHTDVRAAESARTVNALAYTVGHDLVFGASRYAPDTAVGRRLIAHELTHVLQQAGGTADRELDLAEPGSAAEREASQIADAVTGNRSVSLPRIRVPSLIQREGAMLAFLADMEQRRKRVVSLERTGQASISPYDDGKGKLRGYRLTQEFALKLKNDALASNYALVQFIKGELSYPTPQGKAYFPANFAGALYGRSAKEPWLFKDWIVDTPDDDPRFGSHYKLTIQVPTTTVEDSPGIVANQALPVGLRYQVDARMGVYPWGARIPTTIAEWESMRPIPFKEIAWGWDITVEPDQQSLDINFK